MEDFLLPHLCPSERPPPAKAGGLGVRPKTPETSPRLRPSYAEFDLDVIVCDGNNDAGAYVSCTSRIVDFGTTTLRSSSTGTSSNGLDTISIDVSSSDTSSVYSFSCDIPDVDVGSGLCDDYYSDVSFVLGYEFSEPGSTTSSDYKYYPGSVCLPFSGDQYDVQFSTQTSEVYNDNPTLDGAVVCPIMRDAEYSNYVSADIVVYDERFHWENLDQPPFTIENGNTRMFPPDLTDYLTVSFYFSRTDYRLPEVEVERPSNSENGF